MLTTFKTKKKFTAFSGFMNTLMGSVFVRGCCGIRSRKSGISRADNPCLSGIIPSEPGQDLFKFR